MKKIIHNLIQHKYFLLVLVLGIALRLWNIGWSLPEVYEEATPFLKAWAIWNWGHIGFDFNPHFFNYPALTIYIQFVAQVLQYGIGFLGGAYSDIESFHQAYLNNPTTFILVARTTTMLFDIGTIIIIYLLALRIAKQAKHAHSEEQVSPLTYTDYLTGLLPSFLLAINPLLIKQAHLITVDTPLVFFVSLSLYLIYRLYQHPSPRLYVWIGISIGLASAAKYTGAFLIPVFLFAYVLRQKSWNDIIGSIQSYSWIYPIAIALGVFILINPFILLDSKNFVEDFSFEQQHMAVGHLGVDSGRSGIVYYLFYVLPNNFGWVLTALILSSVLFFMVRKKKDRWLLLSFPVVYITMISTWNMHVERYLLPPLPVLILIASIGLIKVLQYIERLALQRGILRPNTTQPIGILASIVTVIIISIVPIQQTLSYQSTASLPDTRTLAKQWLRENVAPQSTIATGPFGIHIPKERFREFVIPFTPTGSENLFMFYQTKWFEDLELLIASDYDYARFLRDSVRHKDVLSYYDSLRKNWTLVHEIKPGLTQQGPTFWFYVYQHPLVDSFPQETIQQITALANTKLIVNFTERLSSVMNFKGKLQKSRQLMQLAAVYDPANTNLLRELAYTLLKLNDFTAVLHYSELSLKINPQQAEVIALEGGALLRLSRFDEAEARLRDALTMNNRLEFPYLDLELLYRLRGNVHGQITILNQYLALFPKRSEKAGIIRDRIKLLEQSL